MTSSSDLHAAIDLDRVVERTQALIRIPSVNPFQSSRLGPIEGEAGVADWLARELDELGFEPQQAEISAGRPNVWGISPGGDGPVVALAGHIDTVGVEGYLGDPFSGERRDDRIHGRGACDMKGAIACFLEVAHVMKASNVSLGGRLMIAGLADEEAAMIGSSVFGSHAPLPDLAIVGEPTELAICPSHLGQFATTIRTFGRAVHSSIAVQGVNAVEKMTEVVGSLRDYRVELGNRPPHPMCGVGGVNAGVIRGGTSVSVVPDLCELEVDRRTVPGETSDDVMRELTERLEELAAADPDFRYEFGTVLIDAAPLDTPVDSVLVRAARAAARTWSVDDTPVAFTGSTDAPNLGIPAIIWGPGSLNQAHTIDEFIAIDQLETAAHLYLDAVLGIAG